MFRCTSAFKGVMKNPFEALDRPMTALGLSSSYTYIQRALKRRRATNYHKELSLARIQLIIAPKNVDVQRNPGDGKFSHRLALQTQMCNEIKPKSCHWLIQSLITHYPLNRRCATNYHKELSLAGTDLLSLPLKRRCATKSWRWVVQLQISQYIQAPLNADVQRNITKSCHWSVQYLITRCPFKRRCTTKLCPRMF